MSFGSTGGNILPASSSGYRQRKVANFTPEQMQLFQKLLGGLNGGGGLEGGVDYLSKLAGGDEESFQQMEKPAYSAFQSQLGNIGSRFAGAGAVGSSAFQNATSGAAQSFAENLGAKRHGVQQDAIERLLGLSNNLLGQKPYDTFLEKKTGWGDILQKLLPGILSLFGG